MGTREWQIYMPVITSDITERYLEYIEKIDHKVPTTVKNRRHILIPFFRWWDGEITELTLQDIDNYFIERATQIKRSSIGIERQCFRSFFQYCQEYLEMDMQFRWEVITRKKEKPSTVRTYTRKEVGEVIGLGTELQDKLMISLMFETGIRIGELLNLQVHDIHGTQLHIRGKGEEDRTVFMSQRLADAIQHHKACRGFTLGYLFRPLQKHKNHTNDRYVSAYAVRDRIQRAFKRCGYTMKPHHLRHSFAVNWVMNGGDIRTLQIILGHASIETTQWYLRFSDIQTHSIYDRVMSSSVLDEL